MQSIIEITRWRSSVIVKRAAVGFQFVHVWITIRRTVFQEPESWICRRFCHGEPLFVLLYHQQTEGELSLSKPWQERQSKDTVGKNVGSEFCISRDRARTWRNLVYIRGTEEEPHCFTKMSRKMICVTVTVMVFPVERLSYWGKCRRSWVWFHLVSGPGFHCVRKVMSRYWTNSSLVLETNAPSNSFSPVVCNLRVCQQQTLTRRVAVTTMMLSLLCHLQDHSPAVVVNGRNNTNSFLLCDAGPCHLQRCVGRYRWEPLVLKTFSPCLEEFPVQDTFIRKEAVSSASWNVSLWSSVTTNTNLQMNFQHLCKGSQWMNYNMCVRRATQICHRPQRLCVLFQEQYLPITTGGVLSQRLQQVCLLPWSQAPNIRAMLLRAENLCPFEWPPGGDSTVKVQIIYFCDSLQNTFVYVC